MSSYGWFMISTPKAVCPGTRRVERCHLPVRIQCAQDILIIAEVEKTCN